MKRLLCTFALILNACILSAAFQPGENILLNGQFKGAGINAVFGTPTKTPDFWTSSGAMEGVNLLVQANGRETRNVIRFAPADGSSLGKEVIVKQPGIRLVSGERYRISALIRTKDFESTHCGIVAYNYGWTKDIGFKGFPKNQDWKRMSMDFIMMDDPKPLFTFAIFACNFKGELDVADVILEALSEKALAESKSSVIVQTHIQPTLVPWSPLVNQIPIGKPELSLLFYGTLPDGTLLEDHDLHYTVNDRHADAVPLHSGPTTITFKQDVKPGDFNLKLSVVNRKTGATLCRQDYTATFIVPPAVSSRGHRRLNNLVVELLDSPLKKDAGEQALTFCTMRNGWVFIAVQDTASPVEVTLDGKLTVINAATPRQETFRDIALGGHTLLIKGASAGGRVIVRSIPEILNYKPGCNSMLPELPEYNWDMEEKYVLHAVTTHNDGVIPEDKQRLFLERGYKWLANLMTVNVTPEELVKRLNDARGMNAPMFQGVTCDEQAFGALNSTAPFTAGLKKYIPVNDRIIYAWIGDKPSIPGMDNDFLSTCINACRGRGRILSEVYLRTMETPKEAAEFLDENIVQLARSFKAYCPHVMDHWGIIFGNFIQIPVISLAHHPHVDYKYYLDMQFNLLANHPECRDMAITGYWGTWHCDFELDRWCFMLTRHYCIEGKTTMLSDEYGFTYAPGHLQNGDFAKGLTEWTPAGNVTTGTYKLYAKNVQGRFCVPEGLGDTFAVLTKKEAETSSVTQTAKGLVPGKTYCFQFAAVDYNELKAYTFNPHRIGVDVTLDDGAQIDKSQTWVHVDKRTHGQYAHNHNVPKCNFHHVIFKATRPEVTVTIHNAAAVKGEAVAVNYVTLNPYLTEK